MSKNQAVTQRESEVHKAASKQFIRELWFTIIKPVLQSLNIPV